MNVKHREKVEIIICAQKKILNSTFDTYYAYTSYKSIITIFVVTNVYLKKCFLFCLMGRMGASIVEKPAYKPMIATLSCSWFRNSSEGKFG